MKQIGILLLFLSLGILLAVGIAELADLSISASLTIGIIAAVLVYLMLDLKPDVRGDATIIRLTKGSWHRKHK